MQSKKEVKVFKITEKLEIETQRYLAPAPIGFGCFEVDEATRCQLHLEGKGVTSSKRGYPIYPQQAR